MADNQRTMRGRTGRQRSADDSELAPTQIPGVSDAGRSSTETFPAESAPGWPAVPRPAPFRPFGEPAPGPAEADAGQTVVMAREPSVPIPLAWLVVTDGPGGKRGKLITLGTETVVGRADGDLLLSGDRSVSSQHAKIRLEPREGHATADMPPAKDAALVFALYDLASTNGVFLGTRDTYRDESSRIFRAELRDGDYMLIGQTTLVFKQVA